MYYYSHQFTDVPQDNHYSQLDYRAIDSKGLSRLSLESIFDGCTKSCSDDNSTKCEQLCSCTVNDIARHMTKEEIDNLLLSFTLNQPPVQKVQLGLSHAMDTCKKYAN